MSSRVKATHFAAVPVWLARSGLSGNALKVYIGLYLSGDFQERVSVMSMRKLAAEIGCSKSTVDRAIDELEVLGAVESSPLYDSDGARSGTLYRLLFDEPSVPPVEGVVPPVGQGSSQERDAFLGLDSEQEHQRSSTPQPPPSAGQTPRRRPRGEPSADPRFDEFWAVYPRTDDKQSARRAFDRVMRLVPFEAVLAGAARYRDDPNRDPAFTKYAATWLNAGSWENGALPPRGGQPYLGVIDTLISEARKEQNGSDGRTLGGGQDGSPGGVLSELTEFGGDGRGVEQGDHWAPDGEG